MADTTQKYEAKDPVHQLAQELFVAMMAENPAMSDPAKRATQAYELAAVFLARREAMTKKGGQGVGFTVK